MKSFYHLYTQKKYIHVLVEDPDKMTFGLKRLKIISESSSIL